jgi:hypothetical protein
MSPYDLWSATYPEAAAALRAITIPPPPPVPADGSEAYVQSLVRLEAPKVGCLLMRNNSGAFVDKTGRTVRVGLGNDSARVNSIWKSSDLIGIAPDGRFLAVEVKKPGWKGPTNDREKAQDNFLALVRARGGIGSFCTDASQLSSIVADKSVF